MKILFFITHSLGGVAVLDFLNSLDERTKVGGVIKSRANSMSENLGY